MVGLLSSPPKSRRLWMEYSRSRWITQTNKSENFMPPLMRHAKKIALLSTNLFRLGACLVKSGKVLSVGYNKSNHTNKLAQKYLSINVIFSWRLLDYIIVWFLPIICSIFNILLWFNIHLSIFIHSLLSRLPSFFISIQLSKHIVSFSLSNSIVFMPSAIIHFLLR